MLSNVNGTIRKLAKSSKFQTIYANCKDVGLRIFKNDIDLTDLQILFLNYLSFYSAINIDIGFGYLDEQVFEHFIYEDAYMFYRRKEKNDDMKNMEINHSNKYIPNKNSLQNTSSWVFKSRKKK